MSGWRWRAELLSLILLLTACNSQNEEARRLLGVAGDCDAALTTCQVSDGDITVSLHMGPGVAPLQPSPLTLSIEGGEVDAENVVVDFQMQGMEMGMNRYRLHHQQGSWHGTVSLPVCIASGSQMEWQATAEFILNGEPLSAGFFFISKAN